MGKSVIKTRKEWFEALEEPTRTLAINNTKFKKLAEKVMSLQCALDGGFVWKETTEGHPYWEEVYLKNINNDKQS